MSYSRFDFESDLETEFEERFADYIDTVARERRTDEDGNELDLPQYWEDDLNEIADSTTPIYSRDRVELWLDLNLPDVEDPGLIEGVTDIVQIIAVSLYEHATRYLFKLASNYGFYS